MEKQYQKLLLLEGIQLEFEVGALQGIVARAKARRTGARGLRGVMEEVMNPIMYDLPDNDNIGKCIITKEVVESGAPPRIEPKDTSAESSNKTAS